MSGLGLFLSEDLTTLARHYVARRERVEDPLVRETVVVPSSSVAQWFEQAVAQLSGREDRGDGVVANLDAIFPTRLIERLLYDERGALEQWSATRLALALRAVAPRLSLAEARSRAGALERLVWYRGAELQARLEELGLEAEMALVAQRRRGGLLAPYEAFAARGIAHPHSVGPRVSLVACSEGPAGDLLVDVAAALAQWVSVDVYLSGSRRALASEEEDLATRWGARFRARVQRWSEVAEPVWLEERTGALSAAAVEVHRCVGLARQVEVARDLLLREAHEGGVAVHRMRVVSPEPATVAALMGVYFAPVDGAGLQFEVADPGAPRPSPRLDALGALLTAVETELPLGVVVDLLSRPGIRAGLGLEEADADRLVRLALEGRVSLGLDGEDPSREGLFAHGEDAGSWSRLVDRVVLASVFDEEVGEELAVAPLGSRGDLERVARLATLLEVLATAREEARQPAPLGEWAQRLRRWTSVVESDERVRDPSLERVLAEIEALAEVDSPPLAFAELRDLVDSVVARVGGGTLFGRGGVSLLPLVTAADLPYEVTCVVGLGDEAVGEAGRLAPELAPGRPVDPDPRAETRAALLSLARSTTGRLLLMGEDRRIADGGPVPTAIVLEELVSALAEEGRQVSEWRHPRHGFGRDEEGRGDLAERGEEAFSSDPAHEAVAAALAGGPQSRGAPLAHVAGRREPAAVVAADDLIDFLQRPQAVALRDLFAGARVARDHERLPDVPYLGFVDAGELTRTRRAVLERAARHGHARASHHPDSLLGTTVRGLRASAEASLELPSLAALWRARTEGLEALGLTLDEEAARPGEVGVAGRRLTRAGLEVWRGDLGAVRVLLETAASTTRSFYRVVVELAALVAGGAGPVSAVLLRRPALEGEDRVGPVPHLVVRLDPSDPVEAARAVLARLLALYDERLEGVPLLFAETSLAQAAEAAPALAKVASDPSTSWARSFGSYGGESTSPVSALLAPWSFAELARVEDGAFGRAALRLAEALAPVVVRSYDEAPWSETVAIA